MKVDRARFTFMNLGSSGLKNVVITLIGFFSTPYLLRSVGDTDFGIFRTLFSFFGHFSILELGLYSTILSMFIKASGIKDSSIEAGRILSWGIAKYTRVTKVSLLFSAGFSLWLYLKFSTVTDPVSLALSLLYCQALFLILPALPYRAYLEANHQAYKVNLIQLVNSVVYTSLALCLTSIFPSLASLVLATIVGLVASQLLYRTQTPKELRAKPAQELTAPNNKIQRSFFFNEVSGRLCLMSDDLIIAFLIGPQYVVPFFVTQKLPQVIQGQLLSIGNSTWSTLGVLYNQGETELFKKRLVELTKFAAIFGASCLVVTAVFNEAFINLWIGPKEFAGPLFTAVASLNAFFLPLLTIWGWCFNFSQLIDKITPMMGVQAVVNLGLSIFLTRWLGITGAILGTLFAYVLVPLPYLTYKLRVHFSVSLLRLVLSWLLPLGFALVIYGVCALFPSWGRTTSWAELISKMILLGSLTLASSMLLFLSRAELLENKERILKLVNRKRGD